MRTAKCREGRRGGDDKFSFDAPAVLSLLVSVIKAVAGRMPEMRFIAFLVEVWATVGMVIGRKWGLTPLRPLDFR